MIVAGNEDDKNADSPRQDPLFKLAGGRQAFDQQTLSPNRRSHFFCVTICALYAFQICLKLNTRGLVVAELWEAWGAFAYLVAAVWAFFEGETFVIVAAATGRTTGYIDPWLLMMSVWIGSFAGDQTWFYLGRR